MPPGGRPEPDPCVVRGDTRLATGRGQDIGGCEVTPSRESRFTISDAGGTTEGMDPLFKTGGEGPCHTTEVGYW